MEKLFNCLMLQLFCALAINAQSVAPRDVVINEILFNPAKDGYDYIEICNRSNYSISLNELLIANRNSANEIASVKNIARDPITIDPGTYIAITTNANWLKLHYTVRDSTRIIQVSSLPSLPDDDGCVIILRKTDSAIIDELCYNENWHFKMISDPQGVALERINYDRPSQDKNNWTSASSAHGFGTPGYINSQFSNNDPGNEEISVLPEIFTPNNDGRNDFAAVTIKTREHGKIANAVVFNAMGRKVRYLMKNEILGINNRFIWDGYDDNDQLLPPGIYIIFTQIFDTKGSVSKHRNCIVLNSFPP